MFVLIQTDSADLCIHYQSDHISHRAALHPSRPGGGNVRPMTQSDGAVPARAHKHREKGGLKPDTHKHWLGVWLVLRTGPGRARLPGTPTVPHKQTFSGQDVEHRKASASGTAETMIIVQKKKKEEKNHREGGGGGAVVKT